MLSLSRFPVGAKAPLLVITGPCVIESEEHCLSCASQLQSLLEGLPISLIFKASYDKANRTSLSSFRGPGLDEGLRILEKVRRETGLPILSDVHTVEEVKAASDVLDVIQIPAFLSRQTDLLLAAAGSKASVTVKKGQFLSPWEMENVLDKLKSKGKKDVFPIERGTSFGYNNLVSDMRSIAIMKEFSGAVIYDASHSVQLPGALGRTSGGQREFIPVLSKAAIASGADAIFIESHPEPLHALSDASTVFPMANLRSLLQELLAIRKALLDVV